MNIAVELFRGFWQTITLNDIRKQKIPLPLPIEIQQHVTL